MRRSREVKLTLLAAAALSITACRSQQRDCVDAYGHKLSDAACQTGGGSSGAHYMYGGRSGGHLGDTVIGGSATPRGGFGSFGGSHGGGGE